MATAAASFLEPMDYFSIPIKRSEETYNPFHWQGSGVEAKFEDFSFSSPSEGSSSGFFSDSEDEEEEDETLEGEGEGQDSEYDSDATTPVSYRSRASQKSTSSPSPSPSPSTSSSSPPKSRKSSTELSFSNPELSYPTYSPSSEVPVMISSTSTRPSFPPAPSSSSSSSDAGPSSRSSSSSGSLSSEPFRLRFATGSGSRLRKTNVELDAAMKRMERQAELLMRMERRGVTFDDHEPVQGVDRGVRDDRAVRRGLVEEWGREVVRVRREVEEVGVKGKGKLSIVAGEDGSGRSRSKEASRTRSSRAH